jgi:HlyD family secretion protein
VNIGIAPPEAQPETVREEATRLSPLRRWRWILIAAALSILMITGAILRWRAQTAGLRNTGSERAVGAAGLSQVRLTGKTQAVESRSILAPVLSGQQVGTLTIIKLVRSGSRVKKGDMLVEFDRQAQLRDFIDKKAQSDDQNGKVLEAQAAEAAAKAKDETEMEAAETALSKAQLEMQKIELLSRIDAEKAREDLDEAKATLAQLKDTFALKRKAAQASIRVLEIQRDRTRETMMHAQTNAALMEIHAPIDGIVVLNTIWKQGTMGEVQDGDQIRPGVPFMEVVDPSAMQVHVLVNQEDLMALRVGQRARIHLDAYPDLVFEGKLESIDPMGRPGDFSSKIRSFSATFSIQGTDPRLMPDLSAAVDIDRADNTASAALAGNGGPSAGSLPR